MADVDSYTKQQQLLKEQHQANPSKYYTRFLYKALLVLIFSVVIQVFPSHAPEFINQTLLSRNWELLHLLFVGIAVSYGLFSRRNDETEKEIYNNQSKFDSVQSLMSRFLQVSSVFGDEAENLSGSDDGKAQIWSSLYCRNEPPVIVAKQHSVLDENTSSCPGNPEKPLLLPVRSLKSRALNEASRGNRANSSSLCRSNSSLSSKRFSSKGTNGGLDQEAWVEKWCDNNNNNVVLPSPIPWNSRSGRMEMKKDNEFGLFGSQNIRLSRSNSMSSSPKLSHSPPLSSPKKSLSPPFLSMEAQAKNVEDLVRKKCIYKCPPPPPPPPMIQKPSSLKPVSSWTRNEVSFDEGSPWNFANGSNESKGTKGKSRKAGEVLTGMINGKAVRFDHSTSSRAEKLNLKSVGFRRKLPQEEKRDIVEKVIVGTTDDDSESEGETPIVSSIERSPNNEEANPSSGNHGDSDVDKKADEFIAKVREQIRLQRIDSIKRSNVQFKRSSTR